MLKHLWLFFSITLAFVPFASAENIKLHKHENNYCGHENHDSADLRQAAAKPVHWRDREPRPNKLAHIKILGFNDFHGALETRTLSNRPVGGAAVLAAYFQSEAAAVEDGALIIHAGDHVGASPPISALLQDEPSIEFLNLLGNRYCHSHGLYYFLPWNFSRCNVVGTLGNHEFDEGVHELRRLLSGGNYPTGPFLQNPYKGAHVPYVNANVIYKNSGKNLLPAFAIMQVNKVRVGVIGAVLKETPTIVTPSGVAGLTFLDEAEAINRAVKQLKRLGVKTIVVTLHQGARQTSFDGRTDETIAPLNGAMGDIVSQLHDEIDVVVSGHAHGFTNQLVANKNGKVILVTQAFSSGTAYADIDLIIDRKTGDVVEKSAEIVTTWADESPGLNPDPAVVDMVAQAKDRVAPLVSRYVGAASRDITRTESPAGESSLGNLIADAQRSAMSSDIAFMNPGGIRNDLAAGEVTWGDLFAIQPFSNDLIRMDLTGAQILTLLNQQWSGSNAATPRVLKTSGLTYRWDVTRPLEDRVDISSVEVNGNPMSLDEVYSVTVNSFIASGGDNFTVLTQGTHRIIGTVDLDALVTYVENLSQPFSATIEGRILQQE